MLDITSILKDAIETCGFDIESYAENQITHLCNTVMKNRSIRSMLEDSVEEHVKEHYSDIEDLLEDAVDDYVKEVVDDAF